MYGKEPERVEVRKCIAESLRCHALCLESVTQCLEDELTPEPGTLEVLRDCAELSQATANCLLRGSQYYEIVCSACFEICERCVEHIGGQPTLNRCFEACRRCAASCSELLKNGVPETPNGA